MLAAVRAIAASAQAASEAAQTSAAAALASAAALQAVLAALPASVTAAVIAAHTQHVTAQGLGAQRIRDAAAMARVQGDTMQEIASKNKLELFGVGPGGAAAAGARLVCIPCGKHGNHVLREAGVFDCSPGRLLHVLRGSLARRTGQILGAVILIGGVLTPILLADSIVLSGESDAAGLAKKIMDCITQVNRGPLFRPFVWAHKYV